MECFEMFHFASLTPVHPGGVANGIRSWIGAIGSEVSNFSAWRGWNRVQKPRSFASASRSPIQMRRCWWP